MFSPLMYLLLPVLAAISSQFRQDATTSFWWGGVDAFSISPSITGTSFNTKPMRNYNRHRVSRSNHHQISLGASLVDTNAVTDLFTTSNNDAAIDLSAVVPVLHNSMSLASEAAVSAMAETIDPDDLPEGLSQTTTVIVFLIGLAPFAIATVEFWRRIAFGESFGTGSDSVVIIGEENNPTSSRGRRVLGNGALAVAYILFAIAAAVLALTVYSVVTAPPLPPPSS